MEGVKSIQPTRFALGKGGSLVEISLGLLSFAKGILERTLPVLFPPSLIVTSSAYGHLKDKGVDRDQYALLVGLKFVNASQKPVLVRGVQARLDGHLLEPIPTSASTHGILTKNGWRIIDKLREEFVSFPFQVPAANVAERLAIFVMPDITERCGPPVQVTLKSSYAWKLGSSAKLDVDK